MLLKWLKSFILVAENGEKDVVLPSVSPSPWQAQAAKINKTPALLHKSWIFS